MRRFVLLALALAGAWLVPAALSGPEGAPVGTAGDRTYVGRLAGTRAHVGLSFRGNHLIAYVCDGIGRRGRDQTIGEWFRGRVRGGSIDLRSRGGATLRARVAAARVTGRVTLADGRTRSFVAARGRGRARFWIAATPFTRSGRLLGGWIRLANGNERGTGCTNVHCCILAGEVVNAIERAQQRGTEASVQIAAFKLRNFARECIPGA